MDRKGGTSDAAVHLRGLLINFLHDINVTRRLLPQVPTAVFARVGWDQVVSMAQMLAGEATVVGKLWTGNVLDVKALADNMQEFFGLLQRLIMLAYGAIQGAGKTLAARMRLSMNRLVDVASTLIKEAVFSYGSERARNGDAITKKIAAVWESYCILKKTPSNNVTAIGEALVQVTVPIKENLRVMKEVIEQAASTVVEDKDSDESGSSTEQQKKEGSCDSPEKSEGEASGEAETSPKELEKALCDPPEIDKDKASSNEGRASSDVVKDKAFQEEESSMELNKVADASDPPEIIKDEASSDGGSSLKEFEDVKDGASVDDVSELKDKASDVNKEGSSDIPEKLKDEASGDEGSSPKEMVKDSVQDEASVAVDNGSTVKDEASVDDGSAVKDEAAVDDGSAIKGEASVDDGSAVKDEASVDDGSAVKDEASVDDGSVVKDEASVEDGSAVKGEASVDDGSAVKDEASVDDGSAVKDEASVDDGSVVKDEASVEDGSAVKGEASVDDGSAGKDEASVGDGSDVEELSPEEMTVDQLTTDAVTGVLDMLNQLGPAVIGLRKREEKEAVAEFVDSIENIIHFGFSLIREAVLSYDTDSGKERDGDELTHFTAAVGESLCALEKKAPSNNVTEIAKALAQVTLLMKETAARESLCDLKKTTSNNDTEIAEALAQVTLSMKENLSKMEEHEETSGKAGSSTGQQKDGLCDSQEKMKDTASGDQQEKTSYVSLEDVKDETCGELEKTSYVSLKDVKDETTDESGSSDWPSDDGELTPEEMTTARVATNAVLGILDMMSLLGPAVVGLQFREKEGTVENFVDSLEKILQLSLVIESQMGEFRMCVFHPQDISELRFAFGTIWNAMRNISVELYHVAKDLNFPREFSQAWADCVELMRQLDNELDRCEADD